MANKDMKIRVSVDSKQAEKNLKRLDGGMQGMIKSIAGATAAFYALKKGVGFMASAAIANAKYARSAKAMSSQFGISADVIVSKLKAVSDGTVSNADLVLSANRAMALGVTKDVDKMAKLLDFARLRARAMGLDTTQAFEDIVTGVGRGSPLILDNLGIVTKGWAEEAKAAGIAYDAQFILNKVLGQASTELQKVGNIAPDTIDQIEQMRVEWENLTTTLGSSFLPALISVISTVTDGIKVMSGIDVVESAEKRKQEAYATTFEQFKNATAEQRKIAVESNDVQREAVLGAIKAIENHGEFVGEDAKKMLEAKDAAIELAKTYGINTEKIGSSDAARKEVIEGLKTEFLSITGVNNALIDLRTNVADLILLQQMQAQAPKIKIDIEFDFDIPKDEDISILEFIDPETTRELIAEDKAVQKEYQTWKMAAQEQELAQLQTFLDAKAISYEEFIIRKKELDLEYNEWAMAGIDTIVSGYEKLITSMGDISATWDIVKQAGLSAIASITGEMLKQWIISKVIGKAQKKSTIGRATGNTAEAITKTLASLPFPLSAGPAAAVGAIGSAQIGVISAAPYARGGNFVTNGPHLMLVGDNPGGREEVSVTPTSSPNFAGPNNDAMIERLDALIAAINDKPVAITQMIGDEEASRIVERGNIKREII